MTMFCSLCRGGGEFVVTPLCSWWLKPLRLITETAALMWVHLCPTEERSENEITNCERLPVGHGADINHLSRHDL